MKVSLVLIVLVMGLKVVKWSSHGVGIKDLLEHVFLEFTNCSFDLVDDVRVVVVVIVVAEGVSKLSFFLVLLTLKLVCFETSLGFLSHSTKIHPKGPHKATETYLTFHEIRGVISKRSLSCPQENMNKGGPITLLHRQNTT